MATPDRGDDERIERNERLERLAAGDARRALYRTCLLILLWTVCGLALIGLAFHTTDPGFGRVYYLGGQLVWVGGVSFTLLAHHRRQGRRGNG